MPAGYIEVDDGLFYKFNFPTGAYPQAVADGLGVRLTPPEAPAKVTKAGTFADHGIMRVRLPIVDPTGNTIANRIRLCDVDDVSDASDLLTGVAAFGGTIEGVYPVRKRVLL